MKPKSLFIGAAVLTSAIAISWAFPQQPEKKLKLEVTQAQAQLLFNALLDCDCPQRQSLDLRNYIQGEYNKQFPPPPPAKPDSSKNKKN